MAALCFALAAFVAYAAAIDLTHLSRGIAERRTFITSSPFASSMAIFTPFAASLGLIALFSKQATSEQMRNISARTARWSSRYVLFLLATLVAAALAPVVQHVVVGAIALERGYVACPRPHWPRRQPDRWALPRPARPHRALSRRGRRPQRVGALRLAALMAVRRHGGRCRRAMSAGSPVRRIAAGRDAA